MMEGINKNKFKYVICYKLDRISRSVIDFSNLIHKLDSKGVRFISIKEQFDTSTPMGRAMMYIAAVFAQMERETIAERTRDNLMLLPVQVVGLVKLTQLDLLPNEQQK